MLALVASTLPLLAASSAGAAAGFGDVGHEGSSFFPATGNITGEKPESKLWWNDGSWWASMYSPSADVHHVFRLDGSTQTWIDTGVPLDPRRGSRADVLWDEATGKLYVASHVYSLTSSNGGPSRLYRLTYQPATSTYTLDPGFPATINNLNTETLVIDKDGKGQLWATWTQSSRVYVNRTVCSPGCNDAQWGTPFIPSVTGSALAADDISSLVRVGDDIGLLWSNQSSTSPGPRFLFAVHDDAATDTTWLPSEVVSSGAGSADDHVNLQVDGAGRVYAALKTSRTGATDVLITLAVRSVEGSWTLHPFGTVADHHTRPIVVLDETSQIVHMLATADEDGGTIYRKSSPMSSISFPPGAGEAFVRDASEGDMNNVTAAKHSVGTTSGLLVLASNATTGRYWHNLDRLDGSTLPGNSAPTAVNDYASTPSGVPLTVGAPGVLGNDTDTDGQPLTAAKVSDPSSGSVTLAPDGSFTYTPAAGFAGAITFEYAAHDGRVSSAPATVRIQVGPGTGYVGTLLADSHVRSNQPDLAPGSSPDLLSYTRSPVINHSFVRFSVSGGTGTVTEATLRLFVTDGSSSGGTVYPVTDTTWTESGLTWNNRPETSGPVLSSLGPVAGGSWVEVDVTSQVTGNGEYACTGQGASSDLAVFSSKEGVNAPQLVITQSTEPPPPNVAPVAQGDAYAATTGSSLVVAAPGVLANDSDPDGQVLTAAKVADPVNGTVSLAADGSFTYVPADGFAGTDSFSYRATDGQAWSDVVEVVLTVTSPPPTTTLAFSSVADGYVRSKYPTTSYGSSPELRSYAKSTYIHSFVRFTVEGVTGTVTSAKLRLFVTNASGAGGSVFQVGSTAWAESGLTWDTRPATTGEALASLGSVSSGTWVEVDVTARVTSNGDYAFSVQGASSDLAVFSSKEGSNAPQLVITRSG